MRERSMIAAILLFTGALQAQMYNVVQISDMRGQVGYLVMDREEYNTLLKEVREETAVYMPALLESKKEWETNPDNKLPFQGNRFKPRIAKKMPQDFKEKERAEARRSKLEERVAAKQAIVLEKEENKRKMLSGNEKALAKEEAHTRAMDDCYNMIIKKMGEKLGRPVPSFGFDGTLERPKTE